MALTPITRALLEYEEMLASPGEVLEDIARALAWYVAEHETSQHIRVDLIACLARRARDMIEA